MKTKRIVFKIIIGLIIPFLAMRFRIKKMLCKNKPIKKIGLLDIEFFHKEAGGFGGYGKCAKNITDYFNCGTSPLNVEILLTRGSGRPEIKYLNDAHVLVAPNPEKSNIFDALQYAWMVNSRNYDALLTMEYCTEYQYPLFFLPKTPLVIWVHDPRDEECLGKIATVALELSAAKKTRSEGLNQHGQNVRESLGKVIKLSKLFKRRIIFTATSKFLIDRAKKLYDMPDINPIILPTPVEIPKLDNSSYSERPSVCLLGRLDPVKRPWIYFELATRMKDIDFYVAGKTNFPELMDPIIKKYTSVSNLKFLGFITGDKKDEILRHCWAVVNTSVHEGLPVSFLEAFAYGKPVISCLNPDNFAEQFGIYTGGILGDGLDARTIDIFENALKMLINRRDEMVEKGNAARKFVISNYSHKKFEEVIKNILDGKGQAT